jgi:hypothetical protein
MYMIYNLLIIVQFSSIYFEISANGLQCQEHTTVFKINKKIQNKKIVLPKITKTVFFKQFSGGNSRKTKARRY